MAGILLNLPHRLFLEGRLQPVRRILVAIVTLSSSAIPATTSTLVLQNNRMVAVAVEEKPVPKARGVRENNFAPVSQFLLSSVGVCAVCIVQNISLSPRCEEPAKYLNIRASI